MVSDCDGHGSARAVNETSAVGHRYDKVLAINCQKCRPVGKTRVYIPQNTFHPWLESSRQRMGDVFER